MKIGVTDSQFLLLCSKKTLLTFLKNQPKSLNTIL
jgi:hypothetical protein